MKQQWISVYFHIMKYYKCKSITRDLLLISLYQMRWVITSPSNTQLRKQTFDPFLTPKSIWITVYSTEIICTWKINFHKCLFYTYVYFLLFQRFHMKKTSLLTILMHLANISKKSGKPLFQIQKISIHCVISILQDKCLQNIVLLLIFR